MNPKITFNANDILLRSCRVTSQSPNHSFSLAFHELCKLSFQVFFSCIRQKALKLLNRSFLKDKKITFSLWALFGISHLGALRFRVQIKNSETNEVQNQFVNREEIVIEDLEEGTLYEVEIFSVGQRRTNEDGSQVVNVQTGRLQICPVNVTKTWFRFQNHL